ncbi:MAG: glutathione S-transferase family protein, partial [Rhodoferax sp.]|nr:glutathione S-transferase family protein [Rhodoferax sp.]
ISRYVRKLTGLYPTDPYQALLCDEVLSALEDANNKLVATFGLTGEAMKEARTALVAGPLTTYLRWLDQQLQAHGGVFFADGRLTIADLKVFGYVQGLNSGRLDHVPTDLVARVAPGVQAHMQRIAALPEIAAYYAKFAPKA